MLMIINRARASPHVSSVKEAVCIKVRSIDEAQLLLHECTYSLHSGNGSKSIAWYEAIIKPSSTTHLHSGKFTFSLWAAEYLLCNGLDKNVDIVCPDWDWCTSTFGTNQDDNIFLFAHSVHSLILLVDQNQFHGISVLNGRVNMEIHCVSHHHEVHARGMEQSAVFIQPVN